MALVLIEWPEIVAADWAELARKMEEPQLLIDGKNCLSPRNVAEAGLDYQGIGRSLNGSRLIQEPVSGSEP